MLTKKTKQNALSISLLLLSSLGSVTQAAEKLAINEVIENINYPQVESQVAYSSVTKLAYLDYQKKIAYGDDENQFGLFWPAVDNSDSKSNKNSKPLVVLIHGGCWLSMFDIKHSYPLASALSQAGYPVWGLEYRRTGNEGGGWPGTYEDIIAGVKKSKDLGLDSQAGVVLMGHSAGGHLALLAAEHFEKNPLASLAVKGTLGLAAITDVKAYSEGKNSCQTATPQFMGGSYAEKKAEYDAANPALKKLPELTVLLAGSEDKIVPLTQSRLKGVKRDEEVGAGHFDWIHPGSSAFERILKHLESF